MTRKPFLPAEVVGALSNALAGVTGIVTTVAADGHPHAAPFGSLWAPTRDRLRFGCDRGHATFENLSRDPRVAVSLIVPPDAAVTVFGTAAVLRQSMDLLPSDAVVEVRIDGVKDDMLPGTVIETGVTYSGPPGLIGFVEQYMAEIRRAEVE